MTVQFVDHGLDGEGRAGLQVVRVVEDALRGVVVGAGRFERTVAGLDGEARLVVAVAGEAGGDLEPSRGRPGSAHRKREPSRAPARQAPC